MTNYQRMSPSAKPVMRITGVITSVILAILLGSVIVANQFLLHWVGETVVKWVTIIGIVLIVLMAVYMILIRPIYKYKIFRYDVGDQEITVRKGIWFIKTRRAPYFRIQNLNIEEGPIMRKYGLATLSLSTAGGDLDVTLVPKKEARNLKKRIRALKKSDNAVVSNEDGVAQRVDVHEAAPVSQEDSETNHEYDTPHTNTR
ncbi:PH domain-containing protein [Staphylococcus auricularis]|uniref:PH domain-containing protein n=1 Tax=Staphylococcus auricularis TaxID=29379 RepID=UPI003EB88399